MRPDFGNPGDTDVFRDANPDGVDIHIKNRECCIVIGEDASIGISLPRNPGGEHAPVEPYVLSAISLSCLFREAACGNGEAMDLLRTVMQWASDEIGGDNPTA
jgi:hypothetical protein